MRRTKEKKDRVQLREVVEVEEDGAEVEEALAHPRLSKMKTKALKLSEVVDQNLKAREMMTVTLMNHPLKEAEEVEEAEVTEEAEVDSSLTLEKTEFKND